MMRWLRFLLVALLVAPAAVHAEALKEGPVAKVVDVVDGDTVALAAPVMGATQVRLVGIQAPKLPLGRPGFAPWPLADESRQALVTLTLGKDVRLSFGGADHDRHGRLLAHLHDDAGTWVQGRMLETGMARVYSFADNRALVADMLALEARARDARRGIWGHPFYAVRGPADTRRDVGTFQLVEGRVLKAAKVKSTVYLNFGDDWRTDFTVVLDAKARKLFRRAKRDPLAYEGRTVRVRGWLKSFNGPMIAATHPEQIEEAGR